MSCPGYGPAECDGSCARLIPSDEGEADPPCVPLTINVVVEREKGVSRIYLEGERNDARHYLNGEARSSAICLGLARASRMVARYEAGDGGDGPFTVVINMTDLPSTAPPTAAGAGS